MIDNDSALREESKQAKKKTPSMHQYYIGLWRWYNHKIFIIHEIMRLI